MPEEHESVVRYHMKGPPEKLMDYSDLIFRLRKRAEIRRQIPTRKSVQEGTPDRIADLLEEAANALELTTGSHSGDCNGLQSR